MVAVMVKAVLAGFDGLRRKYGKYCVAPFGRGRARYLHNVGDVKLNA